nr:hypothetical protein [Halomonas socia]
MTDLDSQREIVKRKREELKSQEDSLKTLYDEKAREIFPFDIGDEIEYEPGKKGKVDEIFFPYECWNPLEEKSPESWAVTGRKINKNGAFGKKNFPAVSNETHIIDGTSCRRKTLDETFGIN